VAEQEALPWWTPDREGDSYVFYRLVKTETPELKDFVTNKVFGRPPARTATAQQLEDWARCISVFQTEDQARSIELAMRALPRPHPIGDYIARLLLPVDAEEITWRATTPPGHFALEAPPQILLDRVHSVLRV
jgi:hypothetical protein